MKKIFTLLLFIFLVWIIWMSTFAEEQQNKWELTRHVILAKSNLEKKQKNWKAYVRTLDEFFETYKNDFARLEAVNKRIAIALPKLWDSTKDQEIKMILEYIQVKAELVLTIMKEAQLAQELMLEEEREEREVQEEAIEEEAEETEEIIIEAPTGESYTWIQDCKRTSEPMNDEINSEEYLQSNETLQCLWNSIKTCSRAIWKIGNIEYNIRQRWDTCRVIMNSTNDVFTCQLEQAAIDLNFQGEVWSIPLGLYSSAAFNNGKDEDCWIRDDA